MKTLFIAAVVLVAMASPALAGHCPKDARIIDQAMGKAMTMSPLKMAEVKTLREKGMALHQSGNHAESIKTLHKATKILGIKHF